MMSLELEPDQSNVQPTMQRETVVTQLFSVTFKTQGPAKKTFSSGLCLEYRLYVCGRKFSPIQSVGNTTHATIAPHLF